MLVIEVDGEDNTPRKQHTTAPGMTTAKNKGYRVIRFWDNEVFNNLEGVLGNDCAGKPSWPLTLALSARGEGTVRLSRREKGSGR